MAPKQMKMKTNMKQNIINALMATALTLLVGCATQHQCAQMGNAGWSRWEKSAGGNGHCYKAVAVTNGIAWTQAEKLARAEGGYLACITSKEENDFVFKLINSPSFFTKGNKPSESSGPALGGWQLDRSTEPDGGWCWVSGEPWNYTNWGPGEPNNWSGNEDRLQFYGWSPSTPAATWNDRNRNTPMGGYVIERDH